MFTLSSAALADSIRIGNHLIATGDSAGHVIDLVGKPDRKSHAAKKKGETSGERWEYNRDHKTIVVTIRDGLVTTINQHAN
ncbi:DUF2845 domain-containing protein [Pseudolysobacter antarcticus]|uniref:DUF2845 domain-containing protein n=1 Tax=Pseudolysobacter antarcticus TaxID=2511995 RepID=A0A411HQ31_9GAMM|nr:DUF2845 domain-containing protein [Pseudolysobacter antarcticus]